MSVLVVAGEPQALPISGLGALPESWVPVGVHRCCIGGGQGHAVGVVSRTPESLEIGFESSRGPQLVCTDLRDGRVRIELRGTDAGFQCSGPFEWWQDHAHFVDQHRVYSAEIYRSLTGRVVLEIHEGEHSLGVFSFLF